MAVRGSCRTTSLLLSLEPRVLYALLGRSQCRLSANVSHKLLLKMILCLQEPRACMLSLFDVGGMGLRAEGLIGSFLYIILLILLRGRSRRKVIL